MSDRQLYYGDGHKTIGPAEPPDTPFDIDEMRNAMNAWNTRTSGEAKHER
jgi:hypothetical protein